MQPPDNRGANAIALASEALRAASRACATNTPIGAKIARALAALDDLDAARSSVGESDSMNANARQWGFTFAPGDRFQPGIGQYLIVPMKANADIPPGP